MKKIIAIIIFILFTLCNKAQELPLYSQYILNPYLINPSIAGIDGCGNIQAVSSAKWIGIKNAPRTYAISYHQGFNKVGIGSYVYSDQNGFNSQLGMQLTFAYHIRIDKSRNKAKQLSFGLSLCGNQHTLDESKFSNNGYDPLVSGIIRNSFIANANAGVYYISNNFFTGLSCANLFNSKNKIFSAETEPVEFRNYFFQIGYSYLMNRNYRIEPSITAKASEFGNKQMDINLKLVMNSKLINKFWFAFSFRKNFGSCNTYMPLIGYNNSNFSVAYAFNYSSGPIDSRTYGSHEIMLGYHFCISRRRMVACPAFRNFRTEKKYQK
jgi:type IX secretion system PorP/SprF family membrane protein